MNQHRQNAELREKAKLNGKDTYLPVEPCHKGHLTERSVATNRCIECRRAASEKHYRNKTKNNSEAQRKARSARTAAIEAGEIHYKSGRDCINGHKNPWRFVTASNCMECNTEKQKAITAKKRSMPKPPRKPRAKKVVAKPQPKRAVITEQDHKDESFAAIVRRVYDREQNW